MCSVSQMLLDLTSPLLSLVAVAWAWLAAATAAYERTVGTIAGAVVGVLEGAVAALLRGPQASPPPAAAELAFTGAAKSRSATPGSLVSAYTFCQW